MNSIVVLVVTVCAFAGRPCHEERTPLFDVGILECTIASWPRVAEKMLGREHLFVKRIRCEMPGREVKL